MKKFFWSILRSRGRGDVYRWKHQLFERSKREHQSERIRLKPIPHIRWFSEIADHPVFLGAIVILLLALCIIFGNVLEARKQVNQPVKHQVDAPVRVDISKKYPCVAQGHCDCVDFETQAQAQEVLDAISDDPFYLDGDMDGLACERLP